MSQTPSFTALSIRHPKKRRCGDASYAGVLRIGNEGCVLLLVADGVSSAPKDWLASSSTVNHIIHEIEASTSPADEALSSAIASANRMICAGVEDTLGMLSTLSAALYQPSLDAAWLYNVGDSRIFGVKTGRYIQLTTDDTTSMPYKEGGTLKLLDGVPLMISALTNAIGHATNLDVRLVKIQVPDYDALVLASDGFYELPGFKRYASSVIDTADMNAEAQRLQSTIEREMKDDASFAVFRPPYKGAFDLRSYVEQDSVSQPTPATAIVEALEIELRRAITSREELYLGKLLNFMDRRRIFLSREKMIELLECMIRHGSPCVQQMTALIRKL